MQKPHPKHQISLITLQKLCALLTSYSCYPEILTTASLRHHGPDFPMILYSCCLPHKPIFFMSLMVTSSRSYELLVIMIISSLSSWDKMLITYIYIFFLTESNKNQQNILRQQKFLTQLLTRLDTEEMQVLKELEEVSMQ